MCQRCTVRQRAGRRMRILIVEDDQDVRNTLRDMSTGWGHECNEAPDGREGLVLAQQWPCDVVLVDLMMPNLNGARLITALRESGSSTPIILMTGQFSPDNPLPDSESMAISSVLEKPFTAQELGNALRDVEGKADRGPKPRSEDGS